MWWWLRRRASSYLILRFFLLVFELGLVTNSKKPFLSKTSNILFINMIILIAAYIDNDNNLCWLNLSFPYNAVNIIVPTFPTYLLAYISFIRQYNLLEGTRGHGKRFRHPICEFDEPETTSKGWQGSLPLVDVHALQTHVFYNSLVLN